MKGALPPSSIEVFFTVFEHCSSSILPTAVEPVKVILRTIGLEVISPPIADGAAGHDAEDALRDAGALAPARPWRAPSRASSSRA